ncbi:uncharacterized protein PV07_08637 [Cladophialophora immunda]|uniref:Uncharacterized protein n=1 Tax=Cladophialophora immunda TaxID=569365 RepID=A0A0D1ZCL8_9EURO|nr:uncharacterized protein PV07_08637 [Cladophialophora immunda]KIW25471.1 hypothetical protein PV07_08637 [Cladophialophora immunda]OQV11047.1 hypothetical protein CLAIMM_14952 [Cladophialophora immunda]
MIAEDGSAVTRAPAMLPMLKPNQYTVRLGKGKLYSDIINGPNWVLNESTIRKAVMERLGSETHPEQAPARGMVGGRPVVLGIQVALFMEESRGAIRAQSFAQSSGM